MHRTIFPLPPVPALPGHLVAFASPSDRRAAPVYRWFLPTGGCFLPVAEQVRSFQEALSEGAQQDDVWYSPHFFGAL
jgi:hypothetical protein